MMVGIGIDVVVARKKTGRLCHVNPKVKTKLVLSLMQFVIIIHKVVTRTPPVRLVKFGVILLDLGVLVAWSIWRVCSFLVTEDYFLLCPTT